MNCSHKIIERNLISVTLAVAVWVIFAGATLPAFAQTPTTLYSFQGISTDACHPSGSLAQGRDGNLYGVGGSNSCGANGSGGVYKISTTGVESLVASFPAGWVGCASGLTLGSDGNFYGSCSMGNPSTALGSLYKVTTSGVFTDLHDFTGTNGDSYPAFAPVQASDGNFYGTTGLQNVICGNVYKMTPAGVYSNLHTFTGFDCIASSGLIQASDGNLYGTLSNCNLTSNRGCVYKISPTGVFTNFYGFVDATGWSPDSAVIQGKDGKFYGTTGQGGTTGSNGTIYKVTTAGVISVLHNIVVTTDGGVDSILQTTDGNFYGVGLSGGIADQGSIYKLTSSNVFSAFLFPGGSTGTQPASPLIQDTNGLLYGTTSINGANGFGTFFSVSTGAAPFVNLGSTSGKIGVKVGVFGQGFTSASAVKFGGVQAARPQLTGTTYLTATVPAAALTGSVTVTTGATTLTSAKPFSVKPNITGFTPLNGAVGTPVTITGTGLTQATKVAFNGTSATFTADSDTQISTTVPTGATTGKISVTSKGGSATSATSFIVN